MNQLNVKTLQTKLLGIMSMGYESTLTSDQLCICQVTREKTVL